MAIHSLITCFQLSSLIIFSSLQAVLATQNVAQRPGDFFTFVTRPDIQAPRWQIDVRDWNALAPGYLFIAPYEHLNQTEKGENWVGPHIYDARGELVWAGTAQLEHYNSHDFRVSNVHGKDVVSLIYPHDNAGLVLDENYQVIKNISYSIDKAHSDMHDLNLVKDGTRALVFTQDGHHNISEQKSKLVGYEGECIVLAEGFKELDITGPEASTVFHWKGTEHIGLDETTLHSDDIEEMCEHNWDIFHFNAIDQFPDGDYLVSSRHTDTIYKISHHDGSIVWRLGGLKSDFPVTQNMKFSRQHHARVHSQNDTHIIVTLFDNAMGSEKHAHASHRFSRGLVIALDLNSMTPTLLAEYRHPHGGITNSRGSTQILPNSNVLMGWTYHTLVSEHSRNGKIVMEAKLRPNINTYRTYKLPWVGKPLAPPNVYSAAFAEGSSSHMWTYVSWNGATEVATWSFYETDELGHRKRLIMSTKRQGFETSIKSDRVAKYVVVEAKDKTNAVLGSSDVIRTIQPAQQNEMKDDIDSESFKAEVKSALTHPAGSFIFGCACTSVIVAFIWFMRRRHRPSSAQSTSPEYEPLTRYNTQIEEDLEEALSETSAKGSSEKERLDR